MALGLYDTVAEKVLLDLEMAMRKDDTINEFDVVPVSEEENKNSSPILKGDFTLGLESWIIPHIYPFAHYQIMQKSNYKTQNLEKVISCLSCVALLNPEMSAAWSRRRELILSKKMSVDNELRLTRMALSMKPKSNEALSHRRWIITEILGNANNQEDLLKEELTLTEMIANRYHSNYHAWSHRIWSFQHLLPDPHQWNYKKKALKSSVVQAPEAHISGMFLSSIPKVKYIQAVSSSQFCIYSEELENNFKWVSCHVSDHSGFHFRKFLINEIYNFLKANFLTINNIDCEKEGTSMCSNQSKLSNTFFSTREIILAEFLKMSFENGDHKKLIDEYLIKLENNSSLFDLLVSIIVSELKFNYSLCLMFPGHEALWYYRRFLIHFLKHNIFDNIDDSEQSIISHQDKNGVPHKKDFKYDYSLKTGNRRFNSKITGFCSIFYKLLIKNEEDIITSVLKAANENEKLVRNYEHWLKYCLK